MCSRGAQWLSGRVLDSRPKGEPHRRHCVVSLSRSIMKFPALSLSDILYIMLINVKMPINIVGILTISSRTNFVLS